MTPLSWAAKESGGSVPRFYARQTKSFLETIK